MTERPLHRLDCPCAQCVPPAEPTWRQILTVLALGVVTAGLMWWRA